jgi:hypothetical protein
LKVLRGLTSPCRRETSTGHCSRENTDANKDTLIKLKKYLWPSIVSVCVIGLAGRAQSIVDSHDKPLQGNVHLHLPAGFVAMSPVSRTLDLLTLLSIPQTVWLFVVAAAIIVGATAAPRSGGPIRWKRASIALGCVVAAVAILEAGVILLPRPMASLKVTDPNVVRIDFHSHTNASRDANKRFTPDDNRAWHTDGGFDVAYISDHVTFNGAAAAMRKNPVVAGNGLTVLSAVEGRYHRILSTVMLGLTAADSALLDGKGHLLPGTPASGNAPISIVAIPNGNIDSVTAESLDSLPHFAAMELVDAAPRGFGQLDREETKIRRIANDRHLVLVASSNNHGWGRTVAAWNLMTIPGWRTLAPDSLEREIELPFRNRLVSAVTIVKRLRPRTHGISLPLTLPVAAYQTVSSLSIAERGVWLIWLWAAVTIAGLASRKRSASSATPQ